MDSSQPSGTTQRVDAEQPIPQARQPDRRPVDQPPASASASTRPFKRPRLKLACQICRDRKIRC
ncbi:hypothetical protein DL95DRAFT_393252, partial [Leptodontidium sp. 2 PMI_412]